MSKYTGFDQTSNYTAYSRDLQYEENQMWDKHISQYIQQNMN